MACLQGPLYSLGGIAATCLLQTAFSSLPPSCGRTFTDHPDFWREESLWNELLPKESFPTMQKLLPQGTSWVSSANGPWKIAAVSKTMDFLVTGIFLLNCLTPVYSTLYSLACQGFIFFCLGLQNTQLSACIQRSTICWELEKRKLSKASFQKLAQNYASELKWVVETDAFNSSHLFITCSADACVHVYCSLCSSFLLPHPLSPSVH